MNIYAECEDAPILPNPELTPGKPVYELTKEVLCSPDFRTKDYRNVSETLKDEVYARYGIKKYSGYCATLEGCEVDHLIPIFVGGSNDITNLWPQSYEGEYSARDKDHLEVRLHKMVCNDEISLQEAQKEISTNWINAYNKYILNK